MPLITGLFTRGFSLANILVCAVIAATIGLIITLYVNFKYRVKSDIDFESVDLSTRIAQRGITQIGAIVADLETFWKTQIGDKDLKFTSFCDPEIPQYLILDSLTVYNILAPLVARAHHRTEAGRIHIHITQKQSKSGAPRLEMIVADTGNGDISDLNAGTDKDFYIFGYEKIRRYASSLKGRITSNVNKGRGAEFIVTLPFEVLEIDPEEAALLGPAERPAFDPNHMPKSLAEMGQEGVQELVDIQESASNAAKDDESAANKGTAIEKPISSTPAIDTAARDIPIPKELYGLSVLIVEDKISNRDAIRALLAPLNQKIITAQNGREAMDTLKAHMFDYIIMDIHMPELGGIETTQLIRAKEDGNVHIPIIALTADSTIKTSHEALGAGVDSVLIKPVSAAHLFQSIQTALSSQAGYKAHMQTLRASA